LDRGSNHNNRGYALAWFLVNDRAKRLAYRIPDPAKAGTPSDLTSQIAKRAYKLRAPIADFKNPEPKATRSLDEELPAGEQWSAVRRKAETVRAGP
jgi:hypothetical protein